MKLNLSISPTEALELVRYHNPKLWMVDLVKHCNSLRAFRKTHQLSHLAALRAMTVIRKNMATNIYLMAAYQYIMEENIKEYHETNALIQQYNTQLMHLNNSKETPERKQELRGHYRQKLTELDSRRRELLSMREVRMSLNVQSETIIPTQNEKA